MGITINGGGKNSQTQYIEGAINIMDMTRMTKKNETQHV